MDQLQFRSNFDTLLCRSGVTLLLVLLFKSLALEVNSTDGKPFNSCSGQTIILRLDCHQEQNF